MDTKTKNVSSEIDDVVITVGGACELLRAILIMHEDYADARRKLNLQDDISSEFYSLQYRFISEIETEMNKLEKVMDDLRKQ